MPKLSFSSSRRFLVPLLLGALAAAACVAATGCGCDPSTVDLYPGNAGGAGGAGGEAATGGQGGAGGGAVH